MNLEDGKLYKPEEVSENGWLGSDTSAEALRKAARNGAIEFTRFRGRIYFTAANIRAIHEAGFQEAGEGRSAKPAASRRGGRTALTAVASLPAGERPLMARPVERRRRGRRAS